MDEVADKACEESSLPLGAVVRLYTPTSFATAHAEEADGINLTKTDRFPSTPPAKTASTEYQYSILFVRLGIARVSAVVFW